MRRVFDDQNRSAKFRLKRGLTQSQNRSAPRVAVDDVTVLINQGEIVGLLGPNGAGKTTTVRMCGTLLAPTAGTVLVDGIDAVQNPRAARRLTGVVMGGNKGFYTKASARRNLLFFADVAGVPSRERRTRVAEVLDIVQLTDRADDKVREFSTGMWQRLHIARALLNRPKLLLLDEPTNGLDPQIAAETRALIRSLADGGVGILLTSHYLAEVEQLADKIQVIAHGREIASGSCADIAAASGVAWVTTFTTGLNPEVTSSLTETLGDLAGPLEVSEQAGRYQVRVPWRLLRTDRAANEAVLQHARLIEQWCAAHGSPTPLDLVTRPATLEESYLALVNGTAD